MAHVHVVLAMANVELRGHLANQEASWNTLTVKSKMPCMYIDIGIVIIFGQFARTEQGAG